MRIDVPEIAGSWQIRFPEAVGTVDSFYLLWPYAPEWKPLRAGGWMQIWEATDAWLESTRRSPGLRGIQLRQGLRVTARMTPAPGAVHLELEIQNLTKHPIQGLWSDGGCLGAITENFIDPDGASSYLRMNSGIQPVSTLPRSVPIRCRYDLDAAWADAPIFQRWEDFWGRSSARPRSSLIANRSRNGAGAVGIGFDQALLIIQNSDASHRCMHSGPSFGSLRPGEKRLRRGVILFGDSVSDVFRRFGSLGYGPSFRH
jgi:hypothetical protein